MKIFHCISNYFPDSVGGTEIYVAALCKALQAMGLEVAILKPSFDKEPKTYFYDGVEVLEYLEKSQPDAFLQTGLFPPKGLSNFKQLLLQQKPDALHFHECAGSNGITIFHLLAAKEMCIPLFTTFHLSGNICMRDSFLFKGKYECDGIINTYKCSVCMLQKKGLFFGVPELLSFFGKYYKRNISLNKAGKILNYPLYIKNHKKRLLNVSYCSSKMFVLSNWYKDLLVANGLASDKIVVLPSVIPSKKNSPIEQKIATLQDRKIRLVYIGRIAQIKGLHILLDAVLKLEQQNWELDIYGPVSEVPYYELCRKKTTGNFSINWNGALMHGDVIATLANYDILVFPSIAQETMGMVMLEAFAAKVSVIASSIWSVNEHIINGENGFIFKKADSADLKRILEKILGEPSILLTIANNISSPLYMDEASNCTLSTYKEILGRV